MARSLPAWAEYGLLPLLNLALAFGEPITRSAVNAGGAPTPAAILEGRRWFIKTGMAATVSDRIDYFGRDRKSVV